MVALLGYSDLAANGFLNYAKGTALPFSAGFFLALLTSDGTAATVPQEDGTQCVELASGIGYGPTRPQMSGANFANAAAGQMISSAVVSFGPAFGSNWVNIRYLAQMTTSAIGTGAILKIADMITPFTVAVGQTLTFPIAAIQDNLA